MLAVYQRGFVACGRLNIPWKLTKRSKERAQVYNEKYVLCEQQVHEDKIPETQFGCTQQ